MATIPENIVADDSQDLHAAEKSEEVKLRSKFPNMQKPGGSIFLQKRLNKGQKYFDSGDYNMAKQIAGGAKGASRLAQPTASMVPVGESGAPLPPPAVDAHRKHSIASKSKLLITDNAVN